MEHNYWYKVVSKTGSKGKNSIASWIVALQADGTSLCPDALGIFDMHTPEYLSVDSPVLPQDTLTLCQLPLHVADPVLRLALQHCPSFVV